MKITTKLFSSLNYRSIILGTVIFASILAFLFTGFGKFQVFNFKKMDPNTALIVGNQKVDLMEFSNILRTQGFSNSMPENQKKYVAYQVLNQLVDQKLILDVAQNMNFVASQASIAAFIKSIPAFKDENGKFSYDKVKQYLASQDVSEIEFFQNLKNELSIQNVSQLVFMPTPYPAVLAKDNYMIQNTSFQLEYALLDINEDVLKQMAQSQVQEFLANPEHDALLKEEYESKKSQFNTSAQYKINTILIAHKDASRAQGESLNISKQEAFTKSEKLLNQIKKGESFSKISSQINDDVAAKNNKGSLGFIDESSIDPTSFEAIAKLTPQSPLSEIVDTPFGYRIFKLEDKKEAVVKTFDDVKSTLASQLILKNLKNTEQSKFDNQVRAALTHSKDVQPLETLLANNNITWKSFESPYTVSDKSVAKLGSSEQLAENVFMLKNSGDVIPQILNFGSEKRVLVKLVSVRKPAEPTQAEIADMQKSISTENSQELFQAFLKNLRESYEKKGKIKMNPDIIS